MARKRISFLNAVQLLARPLFTTPLCFLAGVLLAIGLLPALIHSPAIAQSSLSAEQLFSQGEQAYQVRDFATAIQSLSAASNLFVQQGRDREAALSLTNLGNVQLDIGQAESALASWEQSTALFNTINDASGVRLGYLYQARALKELGLFPRACATLGQTLLATPRLSCEALGNMLVETDRRPLEVAIAAIADDPNLQAVALKTLGDTLRSVGELSASQAVLSTALSITTLSKPSHLSLTLSLANTFRAKGNLESARRSPTRYRYVPWRYTPATPNALITASEWYANAARRYTQVVDEAPTNLASLKTQAQLNLLRLYLEGCEHTGNQCQLKTTDQTVVLSPPDWQTIDLAALTQGESSIYSRISLAKSLAYLKQISQADSTVSQPSWNDVYQQLAIASQQAQRDRTRAYALGNLGSFYEYCGTTETANQCDQNLSQSDLLASANQFTQSALLAAQPSEAPDIAYRWQWQLGRLQKQQNQKETAIATYKAAVNTLNSIRGDLLVISSDVQFNFRDNVEPLYRELVDLILAQADANPAEAVAGLELALSNIDALRLDELVNFMGCDLAETQDNVEELAQDIDPHAAFIYPIILEDRLDVIYKLPQQPLQHHVVNNLPHSDIEELIRRIRIEQSRPRGTSRTKADAAQLYQWLIEPIEQTLASQSEPISALVFLLDGPLRNVPMAYLLDSEKQYLIQKYPVAVISSRQLFSTQERQSDATILAAGIAEQRTFAEAGSFKAIPSVVDELTQVQSLNDNLETPLLNQDFTGESLAERIDLGRYSTVHIATHGEFNSDPEKTFLIAWDRLIKFREFADVFQINRHGTTSAIDLLVLSACETASGDRRAALGLAGAAAQANVRTTLATLWPVEDRATSEFITQFYTHLKSGMTVAKALQQTQIAFIEKSGSEVDYNRPYYWSPFILVGNWN